MKKNHSLIGKIMLTVAMIVLSGTMFKISAQNSAPICVGDSYEIAVKIHNATSIEAEWISGNAGTGNVPQPELGNDGETWVWIYPTVQADTGKTIKVLFITDFTDEYCESAEMTFEFSVNAKSLATQIFATGNEAAICSGETATVTVSANSVNSPVFRWYKSVDATIPFFTGTTYTTSALTSDSTFYVSVEGTNYCEGEDNVNGRLAVKVTVNARPDAPALTVNENDVVLCEGDTINAAFLAGFVTSPHTIKYYTNANCTEVLTDTVAQLIPGSYKIYAIAINEATGCKTLASNALEITVNVNARPDAPTIIVNEIDLFACKDSVINAAFLANFVTSEHEIEFYTDENCEDLLTSITVQMSAKSYTFYAIARNTETGCATVASEALEITLIVKSCVCETPAEIEIIYEGLQRASK